MKKNVISKELQNYVRQISNMFPMLTEVEQQSHIKQYNKHKKSLIKEFYKDVSAYSTFVNFLNNLHVEKKSKDYDDYIYIKNMFTKRSLSQIKYNSTIFFKYYQQSLINNTVLEQLFIKINNIKNIMICSNIKLVAKIAMSKKCTFLSDVDLATEGTFGIATALDSFDVKKECKFTTHAYYFILAAIQRVIQDHENVIRIPVSQQEMMNKVNNLMKDKEKNLNLSDISKITGKSQKQVSKTISFLNRQMVSLNQKISSDSEDSLINIIEDESSLSPEAVALGMESLTSNPKFLDEIMHQSNLSNEQIKILKLKYNFNYSSNEDEYLTNEQCAQIMKCSKEKCRKLHNSAIEHMQAYIEKMGLSVSA